MFLGAVGMGVCQNAEQRARVVRAIMKPAFHCAIQPFSARPQFARDGVGQAVQSLPQRRANGRWTV